MTRPRDNSVALGLGSSFLGYITHAGFIAGLENGGVLPGHLAGSSAGAIAAGLCAAGYQADETRALLLDPRFRIHWFDWEFGLRFLATVVHFPGQAGMLTGRPMCRHLRKLLSAKSEKPAQESPKLSIVVTNLTTGQSEWKNDGDIANWIVASCAVPGLFQPRRIDGEHYADGGIADPVPSLKWIHDESVRTIVLHRITQPAETRCRPWNFGRAIARSHETITKEIFARQVQLLRAAGKRVIVAKTETPRPSIFNTRRVGEHLWELGRTTGRNVAAELNSSTSEPENKRLARPKPPE